MTTQSRPADDLAIIRKRLLQSLLQKPPDPASARRWIGTLQPDGSWPDVDYHSKQRNRWRTAEHLHRVLQMAQAYRAPGQPMTGDPDLGAAIPRALDYWLDRDFQSPNWWYNEIDVPRVAGQILLLMGTEATPAERDRAIGAIMSRSRIGMTGQNQVWLSENVLTRGLLTGDEAAVRAAITAIQSQIRVTTEEGIQPDFSFHQHGPQQQFGNYGLSFADEETRWAALVRGTRFALSRPKLEILRHYLLDGLRWVVWQSALGGQFTAGMDISGLGRQLYPGAQAGKGRAVASAFKTMREIDPEEAGEYNKLLGYFASMPRVRLEWTGSRAFWRSDMLVHRTNAFYASVRICSSRVESTESINGENLLGAYLGNGATFVYRRGDEYEDIFPVWDWHRLPGVTSYTDDPLDWFNRKRDGTDFVGEISDGRYGAAAMEVRRGGITARKAWFFFDNGFACLGAGIHTDQDREVATTLNQCLLHSQVQVDNGSQATALPPGSQERVDHPRWIYHDRIGYLFLEPARVSISSGEQTGSWKRVIASEPADPVTKPVFSLSIEHGRRPSAASYAYLILPGIDPERLAGDARRPPIELLSNSSALQAVRDSALGLTEAVFHQPVPLEIEKRITVSVSEPCLLMAQRTGDGLQISVADPTQKLAALEITLSGRFTGEACRYDAAVGKSTVSVALPAGGDAGKSIVRRLRRSG